MNKQEEQYIKMTETPIPQLIIRLSIPTIISMLVTNIYNLVDTGFVGVLGTSANGAVGIVFGFMAILQAIGFLFGQGSGVIMARRLGQQKSEEACKTASMGFFCAIGLSLLTEIICLVFLDQLVDLLGSTATIKPFAKTYITYILIAAPFTVSSFTMNNILRYEGKASLGMVGLMTGAILNIIGDPIFMFGLHMGIAGAGLSTCISQFISFCILLSFFLRGKTIVKFSTRGLVNEGRLLLNILTTGLPSLIRQGLQSASTIVLNMVARPYGDPAIAGISNASRVVFFIYALVLGIAQGFQPVCSYNNGAKKYSRVKAAFNFSLKYSSVVNIVATVFVFAFAPMLIQLLRNDPEVIEIGSRALRLQCLTQPVLPFCIMTEIMLQATGNKLQASTVSSLKSGFIFIPVLVIFAKLRGLFGIEEAQPVANVLQVIPCAIFTWYFFKNLPKEDG